MKRPQIVIHNHLGKLKCPTVQNEPAGDLGLILHLFADMTYIKIIYYFVCIFFFLARLQLLLGALETKIILFGKHSQFLPEDGLR